jgi:predicted phosphoadenosine phosphosulfate sulfurtransferase
MWESRCYSDGIPDEIPFKLDQLNKDPSYKRICLAILKNDHQLKSLGGKVKKSKYYILLKKIEIDARPSDKPKQMNLKL